MFDLYSLEGKDLRCRIDGMNFTGIFPYPQMTELEKDEKDFYKEKILFDVITKMAKVLCFDRNSHFVDVIKHKLTINLTDLLGVYVESYFKGVDLFLVIQFKGFFFVKDQAFALCRSIMFKLLEVFNILFRITLVDVAQDFLVPVDKLLPNPLVARSNTRYCFKFNCSNYCENNSEESKYTGFVISSGRYKITVYDKLLENKKARNPDKKEYYESIYGQLEFVTRIELRIKQELCADLAKPFFNLIIEEDDFTRECLLKIYKKHKLKSQRPGSFDKDTNRWLVHPNWKYIFGRGLGSRSSISRPDFKYTSGNSDVEKSLNLLIETLVFNDPSITKDRLLKKLEYINYDDIIKRVQISHFKRSTTWARLEADKNEILDRYRNSRWLDQTDWGSL
jgi:hypothetical protein